MKYKTLFVLSAIAEFHFLLRMNGLATGAFSTGWCYFFGLVWYPALIVLCWEISSVRGEGEPHGD